jgi:tRNA (guanosine-2'-O-)-methyltransferase
MEPDKALSQLDREGKEKLLAFLETFLTDERKATMARVLGERTRHIVVAAEDTYQEQNASAVVRSCELFGIQEMHIIENYNEYRVSQIISSGAEKWLDIHTYNGPGNNSLHCIDHLRGRGYRIVATTPHRESHTPESLDITEKTALFFGGEKEGISQTVMENADAYLRIPMYGFTESFNLSVSAGITLARLSERVRNAPLDYHLTDREMLSKRIAWSVKSLKHGHTYLRKFFDSKK